MRPPIGTAPPAVPRPFLALAKRIQSDLAKFEGKKMKPAEDIAAGVNAGTQRRSWTAPRARRLATSAAESNAAGSFDAAEQFS